ncbi:hypothetical protein JIN86_06825 [Lysinibacillus sp. HST-98]|uniref:hypothetical protein n=1 Tax=Lysinibacillus sp. HST-98 TaxID=2800419 RepID=UPI001925BEB0|nr:hypothetical protein [Lysinibacillus sp. HST-98]MBL3729313.1 hypothetical protein [Lysinibacillus sp. HST-98]
MTKFKVGDKVIFNKENTHVAKQFDYKINKPYEVQEVFPFHHTVQIINEKGSSHSFDGERFELVETKPTKNQRITALEDTVAKQSEEINELKLIVHELRGKKLTTTATVFIDGVPADISNAPEIQMKAKPTPNQQRAAIIEKAKEFIDKHDKDTHINIHDNAIIAYKLDTADFGISKCNPSDVFNEHIGKAIALGRALGLDVSEFEQAVQPIEIVKGMEIMLFNSDGKDHKSGVVETYNSTADEATFSAEKTYGPYAEKTGFSRCIREHGYKILNDTNAKYEVSSNE